MNWFALKTKPRQEEKALANLQNQGYTAYLPKLAVSKHKRGRWQTVQETLFPGYLFVQLDLQTQNVAPIRSTIGVSGLVRFGNKIVPIPDNVVELIQQHEQTGDAAPDPAANFKQGDKLTIVSGAFAGINAVFQMPKSDERVMVLINILGGQKAIAVDLDQVVPIE